MTIRSLLEYVGAVERGQRIFVEGREVDKPKIRDRAIRRVRRLRDRLYDWIIKEWT